MDFRVRQPGKVELEGGRRLRLQGGMAEVQTSVTSGEMAARFIEFVRMHAHNAGLCLGRVPHPRTGKPEVNLDLARVLIEQLAAIELKTRGNLNAEESAAINSALASLQEEYLRLKGEKR